jgi:hypothetical protein
MEAFSWLLFAGALLVIPRLIAANNVVREYHFTWLDAFVTAALLFGPALLVASLSGAGMLVLLERLTERSGSRRLRALPHCVALAIFLAAWLNLLKGTLAINQIDSAWLERRFELPTGTALAALVFLIAPSGTARWVESSARLLRLRSLGCLALRWSKRCIEAQPAR